MLLTFLALTNLAKTSWSAVDFFICLLLVLCIYLHCSQRDYCTTGLTVVRESTLYSVFIFLHAGAATDFNIRRNIQYL